MESNNQIKQTAKEMNLFGVMNESKWQSVYDIFQNREYPFAYKAKIINGESYPEDHLRTDVREVIPQHFLSLMWLEVHAVDKQVIKKLLPPKIVDNTPIAIDAAKKAKARFTLTDYGIKIWGYTEISQDVEFYK